MSVSESPLPAVRAAIEMLLERVAEYIQSFPSEPTDGSPGALELATSNRPESIATALSLGDIAVEFAADHLSSYLKITSGPIETLASFTCIRSMLEMTAIGAWILDPAIPSVDRIARVFAVRFDAINQQLKFGRCIGRPVQEMQDLERRLDVVEAEAIALGYPRFRNNRNAIYAIGVVMPNATEVIRDVLNDEWFYRLLSAVAHGQHWAIIQLGFQDATMQVGPAEVSGIAVKPMSRALPVNGIVLLGLHGFLAFARLIWNKCLYQGWDGVRLVRVLDDVADRMGARNNVRFWRATP